MPDWDAVLAELRAIRVSMDKIAALVAGEQTKADLMPVWACGHRHVSRGEAIRCRDYRLLRASGASDVPPNADAGAFG